MAISVGPYLRKGLYILGVLLLIGILFALKTRQNKQYCTDVIIEIDAPLEKQLITTSWVNSQLEKWYSNGLHGRFYKDIDLNNIEERLEEQAAIKNAEASFDLRGVLHLNIEQRVPFVRIVEASSSFYLDNENVKIAANNIGVARVPIATGKFSNSMLKKVYTLSTHVQESPFMSALTEQIFVSTKGDLIIIPKIKNQKVIIGDTTDLQEKFTKLNDFYKGGLTSIGWNKYRTINLKFKDQVVCN